MNLAPEVKKQAFKDHGKSEFDTGSAEAQIALFTMKIQHLTEHLKINKKDMATERSSDQDVFCGQSYTDSPRLWRICNTHARISSSPLDRADWELCRHG